MRYSIDTSALLDGWRRYYPPDVFPALWARLDDLIEAGDLAATEEVLLELERKDDEVYTWVQEREHMFIPLDDDIQLEVARILEDHEKLLDTRANRSGADPFVIALARIKRCAVITGERATNNLSRPNIPDVCSALGVKCMGLLQLIREQGWAF